MVQTTTRYGARETWSGRLSRGSQVRVLPGVLEKLAAPGITLMPVLLFHLINSQSPVDDQRSVYSEGLKVFDEIRHPRSRSYRQPHWRTPVRKRRGGCFNHQIRSRRGDHS